MDSDWLFLLVLGWLFQAGSNNLGGYKTKDGKITKMRAFLRSDLPAQITDYSKKVLLDYGVRCVVDLRSLVEVNSMPNPLKSISEIDYYLLPMLDQTTSQGFNGKMPDNMGTVYIDLLNNSQINVSHFCAT